MVVKGKCKRLSEEEQRALLVVFRLMRDDKYEGVPDCSTQVDESITFRATPHLPSLSADSGMLAVILALFCQPTMMSHVQQVPTCN